jgi:hypothetical protein
MHISIIGQYLSFREPTASYIFGLWSQILTYTTYRFVTPGSKDVFSRNQVSSVKKSGINDIDQHISNRFRDRGS